jgi:hypothetical protein
MIGMQLEFPGKIHLRVIAYRKTAKFGRERFTTLMISANHVSKKKTSVKALKPERQSAAYFFGAGYLLTNLQTKQPRNK